MKKFTMLLLILIMSIIAPLSVFGNEKSAIDEKQVPKLTGNIDLNDLSNSENFSISDVLSFDEVAERIAVSNNISIEEAKNHIISTLSNDVSNMSLDVITFREIRQEFTVNSVYKPSLVFYCQTDESGSFHAIVKILNVSMDRYSNGITKQFAGTVYTNLEHANCIYWSVYGDFYDNGTTTFNGNVEIGVGEFASVSFGVQYADNHYAYVGTSGRRNW